MVLAVLRAQLLVLVHPVQPGRDATPLVQPFEFVAFAAGQFRQP
jgi:hypothetical protein